MNPLNPKSYVFGILQFVLVVFPSAVSAQQNTAQHPAVQQKTTIPAFHQERFFGHYKGKLNIFKTVRI